MSAGLHFGKLTISILIESRKECFQLLLRLDTEPLNHRLTCCVNTSDVYIAALTKAPPALDESFFAHIVRILIDRKHFFIGQGFLSWVFSNDCVEFISLGGALLSKASKLRIGHHSVSVLVVHVPSVLVKFENRLLC